MDTPILEPADPQPKADARVPAEALPPTLAHRLQVRVEHRHDGVVVCYLAGALTGHTYQRFLDALAAVFAARVRAVAVDVTGLEYLSSAGAAACVAAVGLADARGSALVLCRATRAVARVLARLGIDAVAPVIATQAEAVRRLRPAPPRP